MLKIQGEPLFELFVALWLLALGGLLFLEGLDTT